MEQQAVEVRMGQTHLGFVDAAKGLGMLAIIWGHMDDEALGLAQLLADELHDVDVAHLVVAADVVNLTDTALVDDQVDGLAVIFYIQPVADI